MKRTRKGFTLVELLIVIAVIAVLASMMTLSSSDATLAAKAASIANGYKVIGTAFTVFKAVSGDGANATTFATYSGDYVGPQVKNLGKFTVTSKDGYYYATYSFAGAGEGLVKAKFLTFSSDMGMIGSGDGAAMKIY